MWIWEQPDWPAFVWDAERVSALLEEVEGLRETLRRRCSVHGEEVVDQRALAAVVEGVTASYAIEGEAVDSEQLRSSIGRRLEVRIADPVHVEAQNEALAELVLQASGGADVAGELTLEKMQAWHGLLLPESAKGRPVRVGRFRPAGEPMSVFGGQRAGRAPVVHFEAPPGDRVESDMAQLVDWLRDTRGFHDLPGPVRAGVAQLWLLTIHPWEDGNGRMSRAVGDRVLADWDPLVPRLVPLSVALLGRRRDYYRCLERTQRGAMDVTAWLLFFLEVLRATMVDTLADIERAVLRQRFWFHHADKHFHPKQRKLLLRMLADGDDTFADGVTARHYRGLAKVDKATATRHLTALRDMGILEVKTGTAGRSTRYVLAPLDGAGLA